MILRRLILLSLSLKLYITTIYIFGALIFAIFVSAKPEAWGRTEAETSRI
jgi:hypothetical protein